mgnify:CR=1 FL=1
MIVELIQTCPAFPEQYDGYIDGEKVAYLRLRHRWFRAEYLGKVVFTSEPNGDGAFDDSERAQQLNAACDAIINEHRKREEPRSYKIVSEVITK